MADAERWHPPPPPPLSARAAHVWRVRLDVDTDDLHALLSLAESTQVMAFALPELRRRYIVAHGMLRRILAHYAEAPPASLVFERGEFGKPMLTGPAPRDLWFNLSHSGDIALVAVTREGEVGVDVERHTGRFAPMELAQRVFSRAECSALTALSSPVVADGFYAAWTRKEAYMKATGHGITRGFGHFDVTLTPGEPARLLADRLDHAAAARWQMRSLDAGPGYSAAVVVPASVDEIRLFDAAGAGALTGAP